jgi:hypothetical protein
VGAYVFASCSYLQSVNLPNCSFLYNNVFLSCKSLSVLDLRSTYSCVLSNSNAFSSTPFASGVGSIYVHIAVLSQFQNATNWTYFSNCIVGVGDLTRPLLSFDSGRVYGDTFAFYSGWTSYLGITSSSVSSVDLPNVETLSTSAAFSHFRNLTEINMTNLKSTPNEMCYNCSSLQSVNLPMCEYVARSAFQSCTSLQSVNLPMCEYVARSAFQYCSSLQSIDLPNCSYIEEFTFANCKNLSSANLPNCVSMRSYAFSGCISLQSVNLPNCSYVGVNAFQYCSSLQSIDLPNCSYIGEFTFGRCSNLSSVNLPKCMYIGNRIFHNLSQNNITLYVGTSLSTVCELNGEFTGAFTNSKPKFVGEIFVPASLVSAYQVAPNWSYFASQIFGI